MNLQKKNRLLGAGATLAMSAGLMVAGVVPAMAASEVEPGVTYVGDGSCPTEYDSSVPGCVWIRLAASGWTPSSVTDAQFAAIQVKLSKDGTTLYEGSLAVLTSGYGSEQKFTGVTEGTYHVDLTAPAGIKFAGNYALGTDPGPTMSFDVPVVAMNGAATAHNLIFDVTPESTTLVTVPVGVFIDANGNGVWDSGEKAPANPVSVDLSREGVIGGVPAVSSFSSYVDSGPRTYWMEPGAVKVSASAMSGDYVPQAVIDASSWTGTFAVAEGAQLMIPLASEAEAGEATDPGDGGTTDPGDGGGTTDPGDGDGGGEVVEGISLASGPLERTARTSATFKFAGAEDGAWSYTLDGQAIDDTTAVLALTGLSVGEHTLVATSGQERITATWQVVTLADLDTTTRAQGESFTWSVTGAEPGETVEVFAVIDGVEQLLGAAIAGDGGVADVAVSVPVDLAVGDYLLIARGVTSGGESEVHLAVTARDEVAVIETGDDFGDLTKTTTGTVTNLATTGVSPWLGLVAALTVGGVGTAAVLAKRRMTRVLDAAGA